MYTPLPALTDPTLQSEVLYCSLDTQAGGGLLELGLKGQPNVLNTLTASRRTGIIVRSGPVPYQVLGFPLHTSHQTVGWSAAQTTDFYDTPNPVIYLGGDETTRYIRTNLLIETASGIPAEAVLDQWVWLDGPALRVHGELQLNRFDKAVYAARIHQLPLVYLTGQYYRPVYYGGDDPFLELPLSQPLLSTEEAVALSATENWVALSDSGVNCVGLWSRGQTDFNVGFLGIPGKGRPGDYPTGYLAITPTKVLSATERLSFDYALILGSIPTIRTWVYQQPR
ncbi:hypothetical protein GCM10028806_34230 [Spirosoma terrae]|uniref:Uncharacterized protein n=1 Tax=Spirosoma terrae TaxID=1968276 RepID=A0A6L9L5B3_9BACT|nr:hypothetical protein [Spirosoma terrae]NDU95736.1 hypothetical protein [Spirosoma terrae]